MQANSKKNYWNKLQKMEQIHESILDINSNPSKIPFTNTKEPLESDNMEKPKKKLFPNANAHNAYTNSLNNKGSTQHISYPRYEQPYRPPHQDQKGNKSMRQEKIPQCSDDDISITQRMQPQTTTASHMMAIHAQEITLPDLNFRKHAAKEKWTM